MQLGLDTWDRILENLKSGQVVLENESELKYYFFHCCLTLMEKEGFKTPYSVFAEDTMEIRKKNSPKCDMVLGEAVAIEFKHRKSINTEEIELVKEDILRLETYIKNGKATYGIFFMIDQTGRYEREINPFLEGRIPKDSIVWEKIAVPDRKDDLHTLCAAVLPS